MISSRPEIQIRPATQEDFEAVQQIEKLSFHREAWDLASLRKGECLVATLGPQIIGFLLARQVAAPSNDDAGEREILNLAVHPDFRRLGAASLLLQGELAHGGQHFLEVRESNHIAQKLYLSLGFENVSKRKGYYRNPVETAIVMQRK